MPPEEAEGYDTFFFDWHPAHVEVYLLNHMFSDCPMGVSFNHVNAEEYDGYDRYECPICCAPRGVIVPII